MTIYSHEIDLSAEWLRSTELAILNAAVLQEEKQLILSSDINNIKMMLSAHQGDVGALANHEAVHATVSNLGQVAAAIISVGYRYEKDQLVGDATHPAVTGIPR